MYLTPLFYGNTGRRYTTAPNDNGSSTADVSSLWWPPPVFTAFVLLALLFFPTSPSVASAAGNATISSTISVTGDPAEITHTDLTPIDVANGHGLHAVSTTTHSTITTGPGTTISVSGNQAAAIYATSSTGSSTITSQSTITANGNGNPSKGIYANVTNALAGSAIRVSHTGGRIAISGNTTSTNNAAAIFAQMVGAHTQGVSITVRDADILANDNYTHGVYVPVTLSSGNITIGVTNTDMTLRGNNSDGIHVRTLQDASSSDVTITTHGGTISVTNTGNHSFSQTNYGIVVDHQAESMSGATRVINEGTAITTATEVAGYGENSRAIGIVYAKASSSGAAAVENSGTLVTYTDGSQGIMIRNEGTGDNSIQNTGDITTHGARAHGLSMHGGGGTGEMRNSGAVRASGKDASGMLVSTKTGAVSLINTHAIYAGWGNAAGIRTESSTGNQNIRNTGTITSLSDIAMNSTASSGSTITVVNTGTMTGRLLFGDEDTTFRNESANSVNLRNFTDTDGDGVRDTKAVAISDFGAGNDTLINSASGTIRLLSVTGEQAVDPTGQYLPSGARAVTTSGIVHGQLLQLERFENAGSIDLGDNGLAGDVLVITGGTTAGSNSGGTYVSNGGRIRLDTVLNEGGAASVSDVVVLDNVVLGSGATGLLVMPTAGSPGALTEGNGIMLAEVLGSQDAGSFALASPVLYGPYEYVLGNGLDGNNNWYLRSYLVEDNTVSGPLYSTNAAAYFANQHMAASMFTQNILDRRDTVRVPDSTLWIRANHRYSKGEILDDIGTSMHTTVVQLGADVYQSDDKEHILGVYAGFGSGSHDNTSRPTGTKTTGNVQGYHVGAYASWLPQDKNEGAFADFWTYYAWFDNELGGAGMRHAPVRYDSAAFSLSAEAGYGIPVYDMQSGSRVILEPHAQAIYTTLRTDDFSDRLNSSYHDGRAEGVSTRLGARLYGERPENGVGVDGLTPFFEANWLHNGVDANARLAEENLSTEFGRNVAEAKLGLAGRVTEDIDIWTHVGYQLGSREYRSTEIQLGFSWNW